MGSHTPPISCNFLSNPFISACFYSFIHSFIMSLSSSISIIQINILYGFCLLGLLSTFPSPISSTGYPIRYPFFFYLSNQYIKWARQTGFICILAITPISSISNQNIFFFIFFFFSSSYSFCFILLFCFSITSDMPSYMKFGFSFFSDQQGSAYDFGELEEALMPKLIQGVGIRNEENKKRMLLHLLPW